MSADRGADGFLWTLLNPASDPATLNFCCSQSQDIVNREYLFRYHKTRWYGHDFRFMLLLVGQRGVHGVSMIFNMGIYQDVKVLLSFSEIYPGLKPICRPLRSELLRKHSLWPLASAGACFEVHS